MIYRFTIISDEAEDFMREIQIDSEATFLELQDAILDSCNYTHDQMTSFHICEQGWEKGQEITLEDMGGSLDEDCYIMSDTRLSDFLEDEKQHLLFTYDPLAERVFFIELSKIGKGSTQKKPAVTRSMGNAPQQLLDFDEIMSRSPLGEDIDSIMEDEDMFGSEVSLDEIDPEGYDFSD